MKIIKSVATVAVALCLTFSPLGASAQNNEIENVILSQIAAFQSDDFKRAFTFAAPSIRQIFRTPGNFGAMVQRGYPMVWRPSNVRFGALDAQAGGFVQRVYLTDRVGMQFVALYSMTETAEGWKISGVEILKPDDVGT